MASFVVKNNAESTVTDNPLAQAATTLNIAAGGGANFPSTFPFLITLWDESTYPDPTDDSGMEIVKCTGRTTDALTIVRAQEGTADVAHSLGERVAMLITAGIFNDATFGLATKLDGIEDSADVTDATNVNAAGAVMESDIKDQSFTNLLENGDFESWSAGINAAPDGWSLHGTGATVARSTTKKVGSYAVAITYGTTSIAWITQSSIDFVRYRSRILTFGCWVKASVGSQAKIKLTDSVGYADSDYHTGSNTWEWLTVSFLIAANTTVIAAKIVVATSGTAYFDGAILVEGSVCPAFSPKPMPNPSLIAAVPTDAGYNGEVRIYSTGGTRRIYISDGTDWKYVAVAT